MGVLCYNESGTNRKNQKVINRMSVQDIQKQKEELKKEKDELILKKNNLIKNINDKFNIINQIGTDKNFNYEIMTFKFQNDEELKINIEPKILMNSIYSKIKKQKNDLPKIEDITFFYQACNISFLFKCNIPISDFKIDLNNAISIIYNNVPFPSI